MTIQRIMVATDLSSRAALAADRATQLAIQHGAGLTVLHVVNATLPDPELLQILELAEVPVLDNLLARSRQTLERDIVAPALMAGAIAQAHVVAGRGVPEIIDLARRGDADLLVLGAHGEHFVRDRLVSTTTERVVRHGDRPILVVKRPMLAPYRHILVPVDFSDSSLAAAALAGTLAPQARISLLHAIDNAEIERMRSAGLDEKRLDRFYNEQRQRLQREMGTLVARLAYGPAETRLVPGYASDVIEAYARQEGIDLIVMGTEGKGRLQRMLLGSVATHVLHESLCDLLLVRS